MKIINRMNLVFFYLYRFLKVITKRVYCVKERSFAILSADYTLTAAPFNTLAASCFFRKLLIMTKLFPSFHHGGTRQLLCNSHFFIIFFTASHVSKFVCPSFVTKKDFYTDGQKLNVAVKWTENVNFSFMQTNEDSTKNTKQLCITNLLNRICSDLSSSIKHNFHNRDIFSNVNRWNVTHIELNTAFIIVTNNLACN